MGSSNAAVRVNRYASEMRKDCYQTSPVVRSIVQRKLTHILLGDVGLGALGLVPCLIVVSDTLPLLLRSDGSLQPVLVQSNLVSLAQASLGEVLLGVRVCRTLAFPGRNILEVLLCQRLLLRPLVFCLSVFFPRTRSL